MKTGKHKKARKKPSKSYPILCFALIFLLLTPVITYTAAYFVHCFAPVLPFLAIGTADAWIGFAGSIFSGCVTMMALYFTMRVDRKNREDERRLALRPYLIGRLSYKNADIDPIKMIHSVEDYDQIHWSVRNITENVANDVTIEDEYFLPDDKPTSPKIQDLLPEYGISTFTVRIADHWIIEPCGEKNYRRISMWN